MERQQLRADLAGLQEAHAAEQGALHAQLARLQVLWMVQLSPCACGLLYHPNTAVTRRHVDI